MNIVIVLVVVVILVMFITQILLNFNILKSVDQIENYYDMTPYDLHWNIFKCYTPQCVKDEARKCYNWCDGRTYSKQHCRIRCLDYADQYIEQLKFNNYTFNRILPKFKYFALHKKCNECH